MTMVQILIDIGILLWEHKFTISLPLIYGIGWSIGKRHGVRFAVNYITKTFGLQHKTILEKKVDWLIEQEGKRGGIWIAEQKPLKRNITGRSSRLRWVIISRVPSVGLFIRRMATNLLKSRRKKNMAKDILSGKKKIGVLILAVLINGVNDVFGLDLTQQTLDAATYIGGGYVALEGVKDIIVALTNHFLKKHEIKSIVANEERSH